MIRVTMPLRLESTANKREHWAKKYRRMKKEKEAAFIMMRDVPRADAYDITIVRITPRRFLDDDNLVAACKAVRDGIAARLGIDDGDKRLSWRYAQERGTDYAVRIEVTPKKGPAGQRRPG